MFVEHHTTIATAIGFIDIGTIEQVHLCIFCPRILTIASTKHTGGPAVLLLDSSIDVHATEEGATVAVIAAIHTTGLLVAILIPVFRMGRLGGTVNPSIGTVVVDIGLIDITGQRIGHTVCTAKDTVGLDGGACRHVDNGTTGDTLIVAGSEDIAHMASHQIDHGSGGDTVGIGTGNRGGDAHAHTTIVASTKDIERIARQVVLHINEHIAAVLHHVAVAVLSVALTGTIDACHVVVAILGGPHVDESTLHTGLGEARADTSHTGSHAVRNICFASSIGIVFVVGISIVVDTIASTEDVVDTSLPILDIGRCLSDFIVVDFPLCFAADIILEVYHSHNLTTQVVAAIDMVANPGETIIIVVGTTVHQLSAHVGLGMSQDVGITGTGKGVEYATVAQVDLCIAGDGT